jgi:hypothetical protein
LGLGKVNAGDFAAALAAYDLSAPARRMDILALGHNVAREVIIKAHVEPENAVPVSLPLADQITQANVQHIAWGMAREGKAKTEERTVPVVDLIATQEVVDSERVAGDTADYLEHGQRPDELPLVLEHEGQLFVLAGHHHAEAAMLAGAEEMRVQVMS